MPPLLREETEAKQKNASLLKVFFWKTKAGPLSHSRFQDSDSVPRSSERQHPFSRAARGPQGLGGTFHTPDHVRKLWGHQCPVEFRTFGFFGIRSVPCSNSTRSRTCAKRNSN